LGIRVHREDERVVITRDLAQDGDLRAALQEAGRAGEDFSIYLSLNVRPSVDIYQRFADAGVTDFVCAPWMFVDVAPGTPDADAMEARIGAVRWFADEIVSKV